MLAWDPVAKREAWRVDGPSAGMLATAGGLVFRGVNDRARRLCGATDGRELWSSQDVHTGVVAGPISFELDGVQHVAVVAGRATGNYYAPNYSRLLVFRRGANAQLPPARRVHAAAVESAGRRSRRPNEIARGRELYEANCVLCHDDAGNAGGLFRRGLFPDLAYSPALASREAFAAIVLDGARAANGMAGYSGVLDADGAEAIRAYLIADANAALPHERGALSKRRLLRAPMVALELRIDLRALAHGAMDFFPARFRAPRENRIALALGGRDLFASSLR